MTKKTNNVLIAGPKVYIESTRHWQSFQNLLKKPINNNLSTTLTFKRLIDMMADLTIEHPGIGFTSNAIKEKIKNEIFSDDVPRKVGPYFDNLRIDKKIKTLNNWLHQRAGGNFTKEDLISKQVHFQLIIFQAISNVREEIMFCSNKNKSEVKKLIRDYDRSHFSSFSDILQKRQLEDQRINHSFTNQLETKHSCSKIRGSGSFFNFICNKLSSGEKIHMTLMDVNNQNPEESGITGKLVESLGTDAIVLGGSIGNSYQKIDDTVTRLNKETNLPIILFSLSPKDICLKANAFFYFSFLNAKNPQFLLGKQIGLSSLIKFSGIESIPMGYIVVEPGMSPFMTEGANILGRNEIQKAVEYAISAELLGMTMIYFDVGPGAPKHVPEDMIKAVNKKVDIPIAVGGGIRNINDAKELSIAGADILMTGTIMNPSYEDNKKLEEIIKTFKKGAN